jgi:hypothetical protein
MAFDSGASAPAPLVRGSLAVVALAVAVACGPPSSKPSGTAQDEWVRTYELAAGGEVSIRNRGGTIQVLGVDGSTVEIRARRTARAVSDAAARDLLSRLGIDEDAASDRVEVNTRGVDGILIGASWEVHYAVRVPRTAAVQLRAAGGSVDVREIGGRVVANVTNGSVTGAGLTGGVEVRTTNGNAAIELSGVGSDLVEIRSSNGNIEFRLPAGANANLLATATNGTVDVAEDVPLEPMGEQSARRVRGRVNQGGTPIEIAVVNGRAKIATAGPGWLPPSPR